MLNNGELNVDNITLHEVKEAVEHQQRITEKYGILPPTIIHHYSGIHHEP